MPVLTFARGIFPPHRKSASEALPIEEAAVPAEVVVLMSQHAGAPTKPLVEVGDEVLAGQKIGEVEARITAPVHAPISGTVRAIDDCPCASEGVRRGGRIIIASDGDQKAAPISGVKDVTPEAIRDAVYEAGIVGLGGAGFPTRVKLSPPSDRPIDTVIINGCECESYLTADHRVMLEEPDNVADGALLVAEAVGAKNIIVGIEDNKPDAVVAMKKAAGDRMSVVALKAKYPQGAEKMLIEALTGRTYPTGKLPSDAGCVVQNVQTTAAIRAAVREGRPLIDRVMTVTGAVKEPKNLRVRVGTKVQELIDQCGGFSATPGKIILGGPLTGVAIPDTDVPVTKGTSGIVVLAADEVEEAHNEMPPCIRCGRCVRACPTSLLPYQLGHMASNEMYDAAAEKYHLFACIECGSCAYMCPAKIPLLQLIRVSKAEAMLGGTTK